MEEKIIETNVTEEPVIPEDKPKEEITYSQEELNKKIQSETDKVRTEYSRKLKEMEAKVKELTPVEKSPEELALEQRLADIEKRERALNMREALKEKGISNELSEFLKVDCDVERLASVLNEMGNAVLRNNSFRPDNHKSGESMSKDEFRKLSMDEKERLYTENPSLYKALTGR